MQKQSKREYAIEYLMAKVNATKELFFSLTIIRYIIDGKPVAAIFGARGYRPQMHSRFGTSDYMETTIQKYKDYELEAIASKARRAAEGEERAAGIKAGTIFYSSWGYEQTNIDFYVVLERKGQFVIVQEVGQNREETGFMSGNCTPDVSRKIGEPMRKKISQHATLNMASYSYCSIWDGRPQHYTSYA